MNKSGIKKWSLFSLCWITYVVTYLCRVNFSSVMAKLSSSIQVGMIELGMVGSCFFFTYAIGQIVNGYIGDRVAPHKFITVAIIGTGLLNILISFCDRYEQILIIWALNGYFQSMIWGPLMRILAQRYDESETMKVSTGMSTSMVAGFILSWAVFGRGFLPMSWRWYFLVPSFFALFMGFVWLRYTWFHADKGKTGTRKPISQNVLKKVFFQERIWIVALVCFCLGVIKESVSLWAPILMTDMLQLEINTSFIAISIIPIVNFVGMMASKVLIDKSGGDVKRSLILMFSGTSGLAAVLLLYKGVNPVWSILMIAMISGLMYGCNTILLSYVPITFSHLNIVSTLVGIFDFTSYMGAAASSAFLGRVVSSKNYSWIFLTWLCVAMIAVILVGHFCLGSRQKQRAAFYKEE